MNDDNLTGAPVEQQGWASSGNYALTPRRGKGTGGLNLKPVGDQSGKSSSPPVRKNKSLAGVPVGDSNPPKKKGEGLQVTPVGGREGQGKKQQGQQMSTPPSVPSSQENEWDEVNESDTRLPISTPEGESVYQDDSSSGDSSSDEWGSVDDDFTPGGDKESTPTSGNASTEEEGDDWGNLDGELPTRTPTPAPTPSPSLQGGELEGIPSSTRRKKANVYPPGFGASVSSPQGENSLLHPVGDSSDEWGSVDDDFTPGGDKESTPTGKSGGNAKPSSKVRNRVKPLVSASKDDGWDDDNPAMSKDDIKDEEELKSFISSSKGVRITERDIDIIRFLARYRYAQGVQVARYVDSSKRAIEQRLTKLGKAGLLRREDVTKGQSLWTPTGWGLSTADLDYTAIGAGKISYVTIAHTLGLVNIGIELENAGENMLELPDAEFPRHNKADTRTGDFVPGETVITEREIRQAEARWKKSFARIDIERSFSRALQDWKSNGDLTVPSPELEVGNEAMLVLWATKSGRSDHVPDMVVAGQRSANGESGNYAIELELTAKSQKEWERVLGTYADARNVYSQVHYYTHKRTIADALLKVANNVGLTEREFFVHRYAPQQGGLPFWG